MSDTPERTEEMTEAPETEAQVTAEIEAETEAEADGETEAETEAEAESSESPEGEEETGDDADAGVDAEIETDAEVDADADVESNEDGDTEVDPEAESNEDGDTEVDSEAESHVAPAATVTGETADDETDATTDEPDTEDAPEKTPEELEEEARLRDGRTEAVLFSSEIPLTAKKLGQVLSLGKRDILESIDRLNVFYGETGRAFRISPLAGGFQIVTNPDYADLLGKLHKERVPTRLSRAALETLSIIAFKQPVTRGEVDAIRGVSASDRVLRHLIERKLVRICGRAEAPGRPLLYGSTREFLAYFGLSAVSDLPRTDELAALLAGDVPPLATDDEETQDVAPINPDETQQDGQESNEEHPNEGMMEAAENESDQDQDQDQDQDHVPSESDDESPPTDMSHSGEESDDHEGITSPQ